MSGRIPLLVRDGRLTLEVPGAGGPGRSETRAVYTIGYNYRDRSGEEDRRPERPMVYGKVANCFAAPGSSITWDREVTAKVFGECELGVIVGDGASVLGYTIVNDVTSQDPWLDGDQWLLGKSMPGFCPIGSELVLAEDLDPADLRLGFTVNGVAVQESRTSDMRYGIDEILAYLGRHVRLDAGDLIVTGTPSRVGPDAERPLQPGDVMTAWIDGIGELTNTVA